MVGGVVLWPLPFPKHVRYTLHTWLESLHFILVFRSSCYNFQLCCSFSEQLELYDIF